MSIVRRVPSINPTEISKTLSFNSAHTSERLNHQIDRLVGQSGVLSGFRIEQTDVGEITLFPGSFVVNGIVVDLKVPLTLDYNDVLVDSVLPADVNGRKRSVILWAFCSDSSDFSAVQFGFSTDANEEDVTGEGFVHIGVLHPDDEIAGGDQSGRWTRVFGLSNDELARDMREGVQTIEAIAFASQGGVLRPSPDFVTRPYFTHDHQLLVFADRFLIPSSRMLADQDFPRFTRRSLIGFSEHNVDPVDFDFNGTYGVSYNLTQSSWGVVVSRDIEWQEVIEVGSPPLVLTMSHTVDEDDPKILVFENGVFLPSSEVTVGGGGSELTIAGGVQTGIYQIVKMRDIVFERAVDLPSATGDVPQNIDIEIPTQLFDASRHTLLVFVRITAGANAADGGYIQINRRGTATRGSQELSVSSGFTLLDSGQIRLQDVVIGPGLTGSIVIVCLRGSTRQNFLSQDRATTGPFYKRWKGVSGAEAPVEGEIRAFTDILGFVAAAPGGSQSVKVGLHGVGDDFIAPDGSTIIEGFFSKYLLEQTPGLESETSSEKSPREVVGSEAPEFGSLSGFFADAASVILNVPQGAVLAVAGSPVRLRAAREIQGLPPYEVGTNKLNVAIEGTRLIPGVDFEETSNTSVTIHHELGIGQYLEVWVA